MSRIVLNEEVISQPGEAIRMTRTDVPDYLQQAIEDSVERGKTEARSGRGFRVIAEDIQFMITGRKKHDPPR
jgi:hypothetical protein